MEKNRVYLLDEIRGFAIICMVVYHVMFDLQYIYNVNVPIFFTNEFDIVRDIFAGSFIFISGSMCIYSKNNLKRGAQCLFLGMILTFVTAFAMPETPIYFGILHLLGVCMLIFGLFEKIFSGINPSLGMILFGILFSTVYNLPRGYIGFEKLLWYEIPYFIYDAGLLFPLGFISNQMTSGDYFPLFPWLFLFIAGSCFGQFAIRNRLPKIFYNKHIGFLRLTGRHTVWIYLLHQPVALLILNIIFNK